MTARLWSIDNGPIEYHDSQSGEPIEVGYAWTIVRGHETRLIRIEVAPGGVHNQLIVAAVLRVQLDEEEPPQRIVVLADGALSIRSQGVGSC